MGMDYKNDRFNEEASAARASIRLQQIALMNKLQANDHNGHTVTLPAGRGLQGVFSK